MQWLSCADENLTYNKDWKDGKGSICNVKENGDFDVEVDSNITAQFRERSLTESSYSYTCSINDRDDENPLCSMTSIVTVSEVINQKIVDDPDTLEFKTTINRKVVDFEQFKKKEEDLSKMFT